MLEQAFSDWEEACSVQFIANTKIVITVLEFADTDGIHKAALKESLSSLAASDSVLSKAASELLAGPVKNW
jgi:hypothetical protein